MDLNPEQQQVVDFYEGKLLVFAGPGSGKTRCLVHRALKLVERGVDPRAILATTFTKVAAGEMNTRLKEMGAPPGLRIGTFHSVAYEIIRLSAPQWGASLKVDEKGFCRYFVRDVARTLLSGRTADLSRFVSLAKANGLPGHPDVRDEYRDSLVKLAVDLGVDPYEARALTKAYFAVEDKRLAASLLGFDDMLLYGSTALDRDEAARKHWQSLYQFVMVDEAQDTEPIQIHIARTLASPQDNLCLIGDTSQAIFEWRGARPGDIIKFGEEAQTIRLPRNYRSLATICDVATRFARKETWHIVGKLIPVRGEGGSVDAEEYMDATEEGRRIADQIQAAARSGTPFSEMAVLYRASSVLAGVEPALAKQGIPYKIVGSGSFFKRREIRALLAYLRVASLADPSGAEFEMCINVPNRYLGKQFVTRCHEVATRDGVHILDALDSVDGVRANQIRAGRTFRRIILDINARISRRASALEALRYVIEVTRMVQWLRSEDDDPDNPENDRIEAVNQLLRMANPPCPVPEFLSKIDMIEAATRRRVDDRSDVVTLSTVHRAKGKEWRHVHLAGCTQGILPHNRATNEAEERRIFYVALTRAKDRFCASYTRLSSGQGGRSERSGPSIFLKELGLVQENDEASTKRLDTDFTQI